jgi:hypothetical protein
VIIRPGVHGGVYAGYFLLRRNPRGPCPQKDIGRAAVSARRIVVTRPNDDIVSVYSNCLPELITRITVTGIDLLLQDPCRPGAQEYVGRPRIRRNPVTQTRTHDGVVTVDRDGITKLIACGSVARGDLGPCAKHGIDADRVDGLLILYLDCDVAVLHLEPRVEDLALGVLHVEMPVRKLFLALAVLEGHFVRTCRRRPQVALDRYRK